MSSALPPSPFFLPPPVSTGVNASGTHPLNDTCLSWNDHTCTDIGAIRKVSSLLDSRNLTIRQKAAEILSTLASHAQGRFAILSSTVMSKCARMVGAFCVQRV